MRRGLREIARFEYWFVRRCPSGMFANKVYQSYIKKTDSNLKSNVAPPQWHAITANCCKNCSSEEASQPVSDAR